MFTELTASPHDQTVIPLYLKSTWFPAVKQHEHTSTHKQTRTVCKGQCCPCFTADSPPPSPASDSSACVCVFVLTLTYSVLSQPLKLHAVSLHTVQPNNIWVSLHPVICTMWHPAQWELNRKGIIHIARTYSN